jgi:uncharacterized protein (DUF433 family)
MQDTKTEKTEKIPLRMDAHGALRVGGTQVTLDVLMDAYDQGATPEQIALKFGELRLDDVYAVITYYLRHSQEVRAYLAERRHEADDLRRQAESVSPTGALRERLLKTKKDRREHKG